MLAFLSILAVQQVPTMTQPIQFMPPPGIAIPPPGQVNLVPSPQVPMLSTPQGMFSIREHNSATGKYSNQSANTYNQYIMCANNQGFYRCTSWC